MTTTSRGNVGKSLYGPEPWLEDARWLDPNIVPALQIGIVKRSFRDIYIAESPIGSNRSPTIDHYLRRARVPESTITSGRGYWCGAGLGAWWEDAGAEVPDDYANCDAWIEFGKKTGQFVEPGAIAHYSANEIAGFAAIFGVPGDATHIGAIARWDRMRGFISGNTSSNGYSSNGTLVAIHDMPTAGLLGLVRPVARI
jgi:hypothetical protein